MAGAPLWRHGQQLRRFDPVAGVAVTLPWLAPLSEGGGALFGVGADVVLSTSLPGGGRRFSRFRLHDGARSDIAVDVLLVVETSAGVVTVDERWRFRMVAP